MQTPREFVDNTLGWKSSHPEWLAKKSRWLWWIAFAPTFIVVVAFVLAIVFLPGMFTNINAIPGWLLMAIISVAVSISAALTLTLNYSLGCKRVNSQGELNQDRGTVWNQIGGTWFLVLVGIAAIVPGIMVTSLNLGFARRVGIQVLAVTPLLFLLVWTFPIHGSREGTVTRWFRTAWWGIELLITAGALILVLTLVHDCSSLLGRQPSAGFLGMILPGYARLDTLFFGAMVILPAIVILSRIRRRMALVYEEQLPGEGEQTQPAGAPGFFRSLFRWVARLFGIQSEEAKESGSTNLTEIPPGIANSLQRINHRNTGSEWMGASQYSFLFGGHVPTQHEHAAVDRYVGLCESFWKTPEHPSSQPEIADLLVHGPPLSGKTSVLTACALLSTLLHGRNVAILSKRSGRFAQLEQSLDRVLKFLGLESAILVDRFRQQKAESIRELPPQILLCNPRDFESVVLRDQSLCQSYPTLLIDDLDQFNEIERSHIPFLVDRQRWSIESQFVRFQLVLSCFGLTHAAEKYLANRFLTSTSDPAEHFVRLKSLALVQVNLFESRGELQKVTIQKLLQLDSVPRSEILILDPNKLLSETSMKTKPDPTMADVSGVAIDHSSRKYSWVFVDEVINERQLREIQYRYCRPDTNVVCGSFVQSVEVLPVIAKREALSFLAVHFQALSETLSLRNPVPLAVSRRFGIDPEQIPLGQAPDGSMGGTLYWDRVKLRSRPESDQHGFAGLIHQASIPESLNIGCLPNPAYSLIRNRGKSEIRIQQHTSAAIWESELSSRMAEWVDNTHQPIGIFSDLAHERNFLHEGADRLYCPTNIVHVGEQLQIVCSTADDLKTCKRFPVYGLSIQPLSGKWSPDFTRSGDTGPNGYLFFDVKPESGPVKMTCQLKGLFDLQQERIEFTDVRFDTRVDYSVLVHQAMPGVKPEDVLPSLPLDEGTGSDRFSLVATLAFAAVADRHLPGLLAFAFPLAFTIDPAVGKVAVLLVQPCTGGRTASEALRAVLDDGKLRQALVNEFAMVLRQTATHSGISRLPVLAKCNFETANTPDLKLDAARLSQLGIQQTLIIDQFV